MQSDRYLREHRFLLQAGLVELGGDLGELVGDMPRRGSVGIAHAQIDDVLAPRSCRGLHRIHFGKDVGRQALDAIEFVGHWDSMAAMLQCGKPGGSSFAISR